MSDLPRNQARHKAKDASTRFMRVDQLWAAPTVAVPAAELLARAGEARRVHEAPTVARAALDLRPAPKTVAQRRLADRRLVASQATQTRVAVVRSARSAARTQAVQWSRRHRLAIGVAAAATLIAAALVLRYVVTQPQGELAGAKTHEAAKAARGSAPAAQAAPATAPTPTPTPTPTPANVARSAAIAVPKTPAEPPHVTPAEAADQLAAGDSATALVSYQALASAFPNERAFALVVEILEQRAKQRCSSGTVSLGAPCAL